MKKLLALTLLAIGSLSLATTAGAATRGGKMVFARYADSLFLDPVLNDANVDIWILTNLYDTLLQPTEDGKGLKPGLATAWTVSDEGTTVNLKLRQDVKFADGSPLVVDDVVWSLNRARNPQNGQWNFLLDSVESVAASGADGVALKLKHPDATILPALATFNAAILPKKLFEAVPGATDAEKARAFAEHPVGTGPFVLKSWRRGTEMDLARNPYYWKQGEDGKPLPYLDELDFPVIPDDATRLLKLKAGEIDGTEFVPYARVKELQADPNIRMELWPSTKVTYLTVNVRPKLNSGAANPLSNEKVRQALNYGIEKNAVIQITTQGIGTPMQSYMSSATPLAYTPGPAYPYDVAKAKQLLSEAGMANGFDLTCLALSGSADDSATLTIIQQMWAQLGVRLKIEQVDNATRTARYRAGDFQMRTGLWTDDIADPSEITVYFAYYPNIQSQHSGWQNKRVDALYDQSQRELDTAKRAAEYKELQQIYMAAAPMIFLYQTPYPVAFRKGAKGFVQIPLGNNIFETAYVAK